MKARGRGPSELSWAHSKGDAEGPLPSAGGREECQLTRLQRTLENKAAVCPPPSMEGEAVQCREGTLPGQFLSHYGWDLLSAGS